jgi:predicted RecB family nuclease
MTLTPSHFEAFLKCPTKCWLRFTDEPPSGNPYAEWVQTENESYRAAAVACLLANVPANEIASGSSRREEAPYSAETLKTAKWRLAVDVPARHDFGSSRGNEAQTSFSQLPTINSQPISQSLLTSAATIETCLHAVERIPSAGPGQAAQFVPIRFIYRNKLTKDDKLLLAFDAFVLSEMLGRAVSLGKIIHGDLRDCARSSRGDEAQTSPPENSQSLLTSAATHNGMDEPQTGISATLGQAQPRVMKVKISALAGEVRKRLGKITALLASPVPPDLVLNRHCAECEFQARCRKLAVEKDDLSLLAGMSAKERQKLRSKGIFTVTQLSYTFRPRRRPRRQRDKREKYHHALKALAIREQKIHIVGSPELKLDGTPVYLDVEGLPDRDFYYLIGVRIGHGDTAVQHSLWADTVADEGKIWREFLALLETVEQPVLIHYGSYETTFLKEMKERHGDALDESVAAKALGSAINLVSMMFAKIYFPTFSNGLKEIARYLGFNWSATGASGTDSIAWRQDWEKSHAGAFMHKLITYNTEDCIALARLNGRLGDLAVNGNKAKCSADIVFADTLPRNFPCTFKKNQFQFAEFEQINQAAYWDYQRERVLVKSSDRLKRIARRSAKQRRLKLRVNKIVDWPRPTICPKCNGTKIYKHQTAMKTVIDVRFGSASIKKWATMYRFHYFRCPTCRAVFYNSERSWGGQKFGPNLLAFCVYQNIELRLPQHQVAAFLNSLFDFQLSATMVNKFKESAAAFYRATYEAMLQSIIGGPLVHADETKVNLGGQDGYIWVFTNLEAAVYLYSPSREGELVQRVLKNFDGVLVSDFYAAYDSLNCAQQKCLIHLIRDLNDDVFKEPFNNEFKELVGGVAALLKPMIETIDRFGLKTRFLRKHKTEVDRFFKWLSRREYRSETALKCKQRLEKNRETLFTFLDHDNIPWNNNNAEHAIKAFALLRRDFDGLSTEKGIKEYLILLSLCQTCKYMGVDFLDFLRSGEKDIHAFAESRRRRKHPAPPRPSPNPDS